MRCPTLGELPPPPPGKTGWPWTEESPQVPNTTPDGKAWPKISIVTPNYNYGRFIEETIRSVLLQGYPNLEYIIIDGGSTDESVEIIRKYEPWLAYWVSEPDLGQSHAINKGLAYSTGEIFNWINSDDLLMPSALAKIAEALGSADAVAGVVVNFSAQEREIKYSLTKLAARCMIRGETETVYHQPGLWLRREHIARCGGLDESLYYAFDWDLAIRYLALYPNVNYLPVVLARFRLHLGSKTVLAQENFHAERIRILEKLSTFGMLPQPLRQECRRRLRQIEWWVILSHIMRDTSLSRWQRGLEIVRAACVDPRVRWTRFTLGALRRAWFRTSAMASSSEFF